MSTFTPSPEQQAIFDAFLNTPDNIAIGALAGTGKTFTLIELARRIPRVKSALYCAFNKDIVAEVQPRFRGTGVQAKTFHSLAYGPLCKHLKIDKLSVEEGKYKRLWTDRLKGDPRITEIKVVLAALLRSRKIPEDAIEKRVEAVFKDTVNLGVTATRFMRLKLIDPTDTLAVQQMIDEYRMDDDIDTEEQVALVLSEMSSIMRSAESEAQLGLIDFTDMIYWVVQWQVTVWQNTLVLIDEAQDLSPMQRELVDMALDKETGRVVIVGDENQSIYNFAGADSDSFALSVAKWDAKVLPLTVTRRCSQVVTFHAQQLVPAFKTLTEAQRGKLVWWPRDRMSEVAEAGDMILCRLKAPMLQAALELIAVGKPAIILGSDLGAKLIQLMEKISQRHDFAWGEPMAAVNAWVNEMVERRLAKDDNAGADSFRDLGQCLEFVLDSLTDRLASSKGDEQYIFSSYVDSLFTDKSDGRAIIMATVHKSKGMEAERVMILEPNRLPLYHEKQTPEQAMQEVNLEYVAYTRARRDLIILTDKKYLETHKLPSYAQKEFESTEVTVSPWSDADTFVHRVEVITEQVKALPEPVPARQLGLPDLSSLPIAKPRRHVIPVSISPLDTLIQVFETLPDHDLETLTDALLKLKASRQTETLPTEEINRAFALAEPDEVWVN